MRGYKKYVLELDGVGRFFANRARKSFVKNLGDKTEVFGIIQGKGRHGQEVWLCTSKKLAFVRVGVFTRQYTEISLDQVASCRLTQERMFTQVQIETENGPLRLSQVRNQAAQKFGHRVEGALS